MRKSCSIFIFFVFTTSIFSQNYNYPKNQDFESWSVLKLRIKLNKRWNFDIENQLRYKTNSTEFDRYFTQVITQYNYKVFEFGLGLRYLMLNDNIGNKQGQENHLRGNLDASYKFRIFNLYCKFRVRFQHRNEMGFTKLEGDYPSNDLRFKFYMKYNFKKWKLDPHVSLEIFRHYQTGELNGFNRYRLAIGSNYKINKKNKIALRYIREKQWVYWNPKTTRAVMLSYMYTIKKRDLKNIENIENLDNQDYYK